MTALGGAEDLDQHRQQDLGGLAKLPGLETVTEQLAGWIAVVRAEQDRRQAGAEIGRPTWKNLVFAGGPGAGKSRAAQALARAYQQLGVLSLGHVSEVAAEELLGASMRETGMLVREAFGRVAGGILMINDAHAWCSLPDRGQQVLRRTYRELTETRDVLGDNFAVILAGRPGPLRGMLRASPALAARFPAVIGFPGYTAGQLATIFATLAGEAGFTLSPEAAGKAAAVLAQAESGHGCGNARLAVRLLAQATASQARRVTTACLSRDPVLVGTISAADIPGRIQPYSSTADDGWPGQYLQPPYKWQARVQVAFAVRAATGQHCADPMDDLARRAVRQEARIRCAKDTGLRNLPLHGYGQNQIWCEIVALACELITWMQILALTGPRPLLGT